MANSPEELEAWAAAAVPQCEYWVRHYGMQGWQCKTEATTQEAGRHLCEPCYRYVHRTDFAKHWSNPRRIRWQYGYPLDHEEALSDR